MPISFDAFSKIDPASMAGRVRIENDQIVSGKQSFLGRAFGILTGARQKENKAIYAAFRDALEKQFAETEFAEIGKDVLSAIRPKDRVKLTGANIKLIAERAQSLKSQYEALKIPYNDKTRLGGCVDESLEAPAKPLGKGKFNEVFLGKYRRPGDSVFADPYAGVFKKEAAKVGWCAAIRTGVDRNNPQFGRRNIATSRLDERLGLGVIPHTEFGEHNGELGIVMALAPGSPRVKHSQFEIKEDCEYASFRGLAKYKDALMKSRDADRKNYAIGRGLSNLEVDGDKLIATRRLAAEIDYDSHVLSEKMNDLQWLDALCGQVDRHAGNYVIEQDFFGNVVGVQGIDNDQSFGCKVENPNSIRDDPERKKFGFRGCGLPGAISSTTAAAFENLKEEELRADLDGLLTVAEIEACVKRLEAIKTHIEILRKEEKIVTSGDFYPNNKALINWTSGEVGSYFARDKHIPALVVRYEDVAVKA